MRKFGKILSVGLSLTLCASMVVPALAKPLDQKFFEEAAVKESGGVKYIDLEQLDNGESYDLVGNIQTDKTLRVTDGAKVVLNLGGHTLDHGGAQGAVIAVTKGGELTVNGGGADGGKGVITGGNSDVGGGVCVDNGTLVMNTVQVTENKANLGGGVGSTKGNVQLTDVEINKNEAIGKSGNNGAGGGIAAVGGDLRIETSRIHDNSAEIGDGGGVQLDGGVRANMINTVVSENHCLYDGGGIKVARGDLTLDGSKVTGNSTKETDGGAVSYDEGVLTLKNTEMSGNHAAGTGGALWLNNDAKVKLEGKNVIAGNTAGEANEKNDISAPADTADVFPVSMQYKGKECPQVKEGEAYKSIYYDIPETSGEDDSNASAGPNVFPNYDFGYGETTTIEDEAVPLAGLFTRADAIGYLWQQSGEPEAELSTFEDVPEDHQWAVAIGWAQDVGIAVADQEGNFRPDDLVLRWVEDHEAEPEGEFEEFLNRYAAFVGIELDADELFVELGGEPEDIIMGEDAQVIFDDFFAKLEQALEELAA